MNCLSLIRTLRNVRKPSYKTKVTTLRKGCGNIEPERGTREGEHASGLPLQKLPPVRKWEIVLFS